MLVGHQLGFNPLSSIKSVARGVYHAASDSRVQQAAAAATQAYAPGQYATAMEYADRARGIIRPPAPGMMPMPQQQMMPMPSPDNDGGGPPAGGRVQKSNMLVYAAIGGVGLIVFLMMRK